MGQLHADVPVVIMVMLDGTQKFHTLLYSQFLPTTSYLPGEFSGRWTTISMATVLSEQQFYISSAGILPGFKEELCGFSFPVTVSL